MERSAVKHLAGLHQPLGQSLHRRLQLAVDEFAAGGQGLVGAGDAHMTRQHQHA